MKVEELKKYKENNYGALSRDLSEFEKNFMLLSVGVLTFTITFIKDIIKVESTTSLGYLYFGWALISMSIALIMFSFLISAFYSNKLWKCVDSFYIKKRKFKNDLEYSEEEVIEIKRSSNKILFKSKCILTWMRALAILSFVFGISSIAYFTGKNMEMEINRKCIEKPKQNIIKSDSSKKITDSGSSTTSIQKTNSNKIRQIN